jgi:hypothetical protein
MKEQLVNIKHDFSHEELEVKGKELADALRVKDEIIKEKTAAAKAFNDRISAKDMDITTLTQNINDGFEMRQEMCQVELDYITGMKRIYREGVLYSEEPLTAEDRQLAIV